MSAPTIVNHFAGTRLTGDHAKDNLFVASLTAYGFFEKAEYRAECRGRGSYIVVIKPFHIGGGCV